MERGGAGEGRPAGKDSSQQEQKKESGISDSFCLFVCFGGFVLVLFLINES